MRTIPNNPGPPAHGIPKNGRGKSTKPPGRPCKARPFVWGTFRLEHVRFHEHFRREGDKQGVNDKGLVTADRKTRKDAFFFYKANWSAEPVLYITSRRFTDRTNAVTNVKIYSNALAPELLLNGTSLAQRSDGTNCVFIWPKSGCSPAKTASKPAPNTTGTT